MHTARQCAVCGCRFLEADLEPAQEADGPKERRRVKPVPNKPPVITINLPVLLGLVLLVLAFNALIVFGLQKREETDNLVAAQQATATYIATTYVSPTPEPTMTFTPGPPTETPYVEVTYEVQPGDSCLSIADRFDVYLDSLLLRNDIDCAALQVGTVLRIPPPVVTAVPTDTPAP